MRLRILIPFALSGVAVLSSCSNSRNLAAPNKPVYRAQVVQAPPVQIARSHKRSVPGPRLITRSAPKPVMTATPQPVNRYTQVAVKPKLPEVKINPAPAPKTPTPPRVVSAPAPPKRAPSSLRGGQVVRTTAYTHTEADSLQYGLKNAAGGNLKYGRVRSAAADWSVYPVGTVFKMDGDPNVYEIDDYGSALVGSKTIDIYKPSKQSMNAWGVRHVPIKVLRWGSFEKSLEILEPRETKAAHVRQMAKSIRAKGL